MYDLRILQIISVWNSLPILQEKLFQIA